MCLAIPGRILEILDPDELTRTGRVRFGGVEKTICLTYTPDAGVGDWVIVHVGFAISQLDEAAAGKVFEYLELGGHS